MTLEATPKDATHWSTRSMARRSGVSHNTVSRIWRAFALQPHRTETLKLSADPLFIEKVRDIVGFYLNPPDRALVLCVDEKSHIQVLDRTRPLLPLRPGQAERRTHDYVRHGATSLFAALDARTGQVIGQCHRRHQALEFRKFLDAIESEAPAELDVHLIAGNYATHKTALIRNWFARRPRFHIHFTPTSASWLNLAGRAGSVCSPKSSCAGACIRAAPNWRLPSTATWTSPTKTSSPSYGPRPLTKSWPAWLAFASVLWIQDTRQPKPSPSRAFQTIFQRSHPTHASNDGFLSHSWVSILILS